MNAQHILGFGEPAKSWFKCLRSTEACELCLGFPNAFRLLFIIAYRAQRTVGFNRHRLEPGQALLGNLENVGMSEKEYRTAKRQLEDYGFATFEGTHRGTIATLKDSKIFDINPEISFKIRANGEANAGADQEATAEIAQLANTHAIPETEVALEANHGADARADERAIDGRTEGERGATSNSIKKEKNAKNDLTPATGGRRRPSKFSPEIHQRALELFEAWKESWAGNMEGLALDVDFKRDARALHTLASVRRSDGTLLPVPEILGVARWAWAQHRTVLAKTGRSDFLLEQSLTPLRFAPRFAELQVRKAAGYNGVNHSESRAKNGSAKNISQRINLDRVIPEMENRVRELNDLLNLHPTGDKIPQLKSERDAVQEKLSSAREQRRKLAVGTDDQRNETNGKSEQ